MLQSLRDENIIRFNMAAHTRRDFLPVEFCAGAIMRAVAKRISVTFNLGGAPSNAK